MFAGIGAKSDHLLCVAQECRMERNILSTLKLITLLHALRGRILAPGRLITSIVVSSI